MSALPPTFVSGFHDENEVKKMKYNKFGNTGMLVSHLSIGTGGFSYFYGDYSVDECKKTLHQALKNGINYIDTAPWYGHGESEEVLGKCLEGVPRQAYYLATKVGRYEKDPKKMFDFSAEKTKWSIDNSLKKLGVDYFDVIQVHDIEFAKSLDIVLNETLPVLEEAVTAGKARHIGVTGYPVSVLDQCIKTSKTKIELLLSYTRLSLVDQTLNQYLPYFQSKNLGVVNAAAHCMGLLTNKGPESWHPVGEHIKTVCNEARQYCIVNKVDIAKLAVFYSFQQPGPHTHLVGMNTCEILQANLDTLYNGLTTQEKSVLEYLQSNIFTKLRKGDWEDANEVFKKTLYY